MLLITKVRINNQDLILAEAGRSLLVQGQYRLQSYGKLKEKRMKKKCNQDLSLASNYKGIKNNLILTKLNEFS